MSKTIVTLVGKDKVGIIATVCNFFAENNINILDLKQTTSQGYINMMMIVDTDLYKVPSRTSTRVWMRSAAESNASSRPSTKRYST